MNENNVRFNFAVSIEQESAMRIMAEAGGYESIAEMIRAALKQHATVLGVAFPDNVQAQPYRAAKRRRA